MAKAMMKLDDAQAHAHSLANEALAKMLVDGGVGKMLMKLVELRPYLLELAKRFTHLTKGEDILGYTSMDGEKGFCLGEIGRTYRACKYAMDGDRKPQTKKPTPTPKQLTDGTPTPTENKTEQSSVSITTLKMNQVVRIEGFGEQQWIVKLGTQANKMKALPIFVMHWDAPTKPTVRKHKYTVVLHLKGKTPRAAACGSKKKGCRLGEDDFRIHVDSERQQRCKKCLALQTDQPAQPTPTKVRITHRITSSSDFSTLCGKRTNSKGAAGLNQKPTCAECAKIVEENKKDKERDDADHRVWMAHHPEMSEGDAPDPKVPKLVHEDGGYTVLEYTEPMFGDVHRLDLSHGVPEHTSVYDDPSMGPDPYPQPNFYYVGCIDGSPTEAFTCLGDAKEWIEDEKEYEARMLAEEVQEQSEPAKALTADDGADVPKVCSEEK